MRTQAAPARETRRTSNFGSRRAPRAPSEVVLDSLLSQIEVRNLSDQDVDETLKTDPLERFRDQILYELTPVLLDLAEKYAPKGVTIQMDASNFLQGGRGVRLDLAIGPFRHVLQGTVTSEAIGFEEIRYSPNSDGDITSGPMLRLRQLKAESFRDFICKRVVILLKLSVKPR